MSQPLKGLGQPLRSLGQSLRGLGHPLKGLGGTYGRTDVCTDVQIPSVFYRTSSPPVPSGADAQKGYITCTESFSFFGYI